jgi:hypothetical protein
MLIVGRVLESHCGKFLKRKSVVSRVRVEDDLWDVRPEMSKFVKVLARSEAHLVTDSFT